jgi:hypothetical protein
MIALVEAKRLSGTSRDIVTILTVFGIVIIGSFIMDMEGTLEAFKTVLEYIDEFIRRINKI